MNTKYIISIDSGSSGLRAALFATDGSLVREAYRRTLPTTSHLGEVVHDTELLWEALLECLREVSEAVPRGSIAAAGVCNQRGSFCLWEKQSGRVMTPLIGWADVRATATAREMNANFKWRALQTVARATGRLTRSRMMQATGMLEFTSDHASCRLKWLLDNDPALRRRAFAGELAFGTLDTFFIHRLTGGVLHCTDAGNAGATGLFNPFQMRWNDILGNIFGLPMQIFGEVRDTNGDFGITAEGILPTQVPIRAAVGDQMAALFGQHCFSPGQAKVSLGSGAFVDVNVGGRPRLSLRGLPPLIAWKMEGRPTYMLEGHAATAGTMLDWLGPCLGLAENAAAIDALALQVPDSGGVQFFPHPAGVRYPHFATDLRAALLGLSLATHREHVARAVIEGLALRVAEIVTGMEQDTGIAIGRLRADGGVSHSTLLLQLIADYSGKIVERSKEFEMTAFGTALLAGLGAGVWKDRRDLPSAKIDRAFTPQLKPEQRREVLEKRNRALAALLSLR